MGILQDIETAWDFHQKNKEAAEKKETPAPTVGTMKNKVKNAAGYKKYQEDTVLKGDTPKSMEEWAAEQ
jgi:hypothetical protein